MRDYLACSIGVATLAIAYMLEVLGFFLYSGYLLVRIVGLIAAVAFVIYGAVLVRKRSPVAALCTFLMSVIFLVSAWKVAAAVTTPRKRFYLLAETIKPNDTLESVNARLAGYTSWSDGEGHVSFNFASAPGTTDVVVIQYDPKSLRVLNASLSLD